MIPALLAQVGGEGFLPPLETPRVEYSAIFPWLTLVGAALLLLVATSVVRRKPPLGFYTLFTAAAGAVSLVSSFVLWDDVRDPDGGAYRAVADAVVVDGFAVFFFVLIAGAVILAALTGEAYLRRERLDGAEFHVLMMLSASGGMLMASANDLIVLFLGLEILSIALYVLAGFHGRRTESREAAIKYFVLGSFSSAIFLYGIALTYGATGSTNLAEIAGFLAGNVITDNGVLLAGVALLLVGLGFKVAAVPFHAWTPDVYQGSPTPVTAFMAAASKAAGFAGLLRVFTSAFDVLRLDWQPLIGALAVLTLLVGSVLAVVQSDIKRMLAYSSISHAGYVLIGLQAATDAGVAGSLYYLFVYTFLVMGSFAVVALVGRKGDDDHSLDAYRGLATRRPGLALAFTVFLLAQAGVPATTGFLAKFYVISAAVDARSYWLALLGMLSAVIAAFFYLRITVLMYMAPAEGAEAAPRIPLPFTTGLVLAITLAFTVGFGLVPDPVVRFARDATLLF